MRIEDNGPLFNTGHDMVFFSVGCLNECKIDDQPVAEGIEYKMKKGTKRNVTASGVFLSIECGSKNSV